MSVMIGADVEGLRACSKAFGVTADRFGSIRQEIHSQVGSSSWIGRDADAFRADWDTRLSIDIGRIVEFLRLAAEALLRQALEQERASSEGVNGNTGGQVSAGGLGSTGQDPGANVQYPPGLDPNSDIAKKLSSTERGRRILQWMHDNNITVVIDPNVRGAYYSDRTMYLGGGYVNSSTVMHEANHASWDVEGRTPDIHQPRDSYVKTMVDQEADCVWLEVQAAKELRAAGGSAPLDIAEERYDRAYNSAYNQAVTAGQDDAAARKTADDAGRAEVRKMFTDGTYVTSTNGKNYEQYYGDAWDQAN